MTFSDVIYISVSKISARDLWVIMLILAKTIETILYIEIKLAGEAREVAINGLPVISQVDEIGHLQINNQ